MLNAIAMKHPCELNEFCVLTTTKSRAKIWFQFVVDSLFIIAPIVCRGSVFVPCFGVQYLCPHLDGEERAGCFTSVVFLMSCYCECSVPALPHGAVGWSAVCDCGIS